MTGPTRPTVTRRRVLQLGGAAAAAAALAACTSSAGGDGGGPTVGGGEDTPGVRGGTADLQGPMPPTDVVLTATGAGTASLTWTTGSVPSGTVRHRVHRDGAVVDTVEGTSAELTDLRAGTDVALAVTSVDTDGSESEPSATVVRSGPTAADAPAADALPFVTAVAALRGAVVRWAAPDADGAAVPASYRVLATGNGTPLAELRGTGTAAAPTSVFLRDQPTDAPLELTVQGLDDEGQVVAESRNRVRVQPYDRAVVADYTGPTVPGSVTASATAGGLSVRWDASTDDGTGVLGYLVLVDGVFRAQVEGGATEVEVGGVGGTSARAVTVVAYDGAGNPSSPSEPASATPGAGESGAAAAVAGFTVDGTRLLRPDGTELVPVGANVPGPDFFWADEVRGHADAAADAWRWTVVRANCGLRDWGSVGGDSGYLYFVNNQLLPVVQEYSARKVAVMLSQHTRGGAASGTNLPTEAGSAPDGSGRSVEQGVTDWWVDVALLVRDDPYAWLNLVNEPGGDLDGLDAQYRRMLARIRSVAPRCVIVLDAAQFANDIPADATIGTGVVAADQSYVLSRAAALAADFGPAAGYGPVVFSVHLYSRWPTSYTAAGGLVSAEQLAARIRDLVTRARDRGLVLLVGEIGVEPAFTEADSLVTQVAMYYGGGVLPDEKVGVLAWHVSRTSGMALTTSKPWYEATSRADCAAAPQVGAGLWDYAHALAGAG